MRTKGFTLIELMVTVAIVAILAAIAYPSYVDQVRKSRRSDAIAALLKTAQVLERCYTEYNAYNDTGCPAVDNSDDAKLAASYASTDEGYYSISASSLTASSFALQAVPQNDQVNDKCGTLTFNHVGKKGIKDADSGVTISDCW